MPLPHCNEAADLAQQVEHIHGKDGVPGPNPGVGSSDINSSQVLVCGLFFFDNQIITMNAQIAA